MLPLNSFFSHALIIITASILGLALYSARRREIPGSAEFSLLCLATSFYTFGYAMELLSQSIDKVDFWSKFQYVGIPYIPAIWVLIAIAYSGIESKKNLYFYAGLFLIPILTTIFRFTSASTHFYYGEMELVNNGYFLALQFDKGPWYYVQVIYFFICAAYAFMNFLGVYKRSTGYMKRQSLIMMLASVLPSCAIIMNAFCLTPFNLDSGPFTVIFDYLLFSYGLFRYSRQHLMPLTRNKIFDWMRDGVLILNTQLHILDCNRTAQQIFPELTSESIGHPLEKCLVNHQEFISRTYDWLSAEHSRDEAFGTSGAVGFEFQSSDADDSILHYQTRISRLYDRGELIGTTILISNITEQYEMMRQLEQSARTDGLTGLLNRDYLIERIDYEITRAERENSDVALIIFDIDSFKSINDTYGHQAGDHALRKLSQVVLRNIRAVDLAGRYGGDEFVIFLPGADITEAAAVAERIRASFETAGIDWAGVPLKLTSSFGVAADHASDMHPNVHHARIDYDDLVRRADKALYTAKSNGRNRVEIQ